MPDEKQGGQADGQADGQAGRSLRERLEWELLKRGLAQAADGALDAVERSLFGRVGGAEEAERGLAAESALERVRAQYGVEKQAPGTTRQDIDQTTDRIREQARAYLTGPEAGKAAGKVAPAEDPVERARAQLAELKRAMKKDPEKGPGEGR